MNITNVMKYKNVMGTMMLVLAIILFTVIANGCVTAPRVSYVVNTPAAITNDIAFDSPVVKLNYMDGSFCSGVILSNNEVVTSNHCLTTPVSRINDDGEMRILSEKADFSKMTLGTILVDTTNNRVMPERIHPKLHEGLIVTVRGYGCSTFVNGVETISDKSGEIINYNALTGIFEVMSVDQLCVGDSGAAVYSQTGKLIGVVASKVDSPVSLFQAVDVSWQQE